MGLASSQTRLLALTSREHDITRELQVLAIRKQEMTRQASEASREYSESFNASIFKWSNGGATYQDITYSALMSPTGGVSGATKPILLTNQDGKIVVDNRYIGFAKKISPNGEPGAKWEGDLRYQILSEVTGISADKIKAAEASSNKVNELEEKKNAAEKAMDEHKLKETTYLDGSTESQLLTKGYSGVKKAHVKSASEFKAITNSIANNIASQMTPEDATAWRAACDSVYGTYEKQIYETGENADNARKEGVITGNANDCDVDVQKLLQDIIADYATKGGRYGLNNDTKKPYLKKNGWETWNTEMQRLKGVFDNANAEYIAAVQSDNTVLDSTETKNRIKFYDNLFTAIAEQGWIYDNQVSEDNSYLNNQLQNSVYCLTVMTTNNDYVAGSSDPVTKNKFDYTVGSVLYNDNVVKVNDPNVKTEALAVYENKKAEINAKESKLDLRISKLNTELKSIEAMIEGIEKVRDENSDEYMNIFA